jgi:hypothetical protein
MLCPFPGRFNHNPSLLGLQFGQKLVSDQRFPFTMSKVAFLADALLLLTIWYLFIPSPALAYFDLGTGTYIVQLIFGVGAAFLLSFKSSVVKWFRRSKAKHEVAAGPEQEEVV